MNSKLFFILFLTTIIHNYSVAKNKLEFSCLTNNHGKRTIHSTPHQKYYIYHFYKNRKLQLMIKQDKETIYQQTKKESPIETIEATTMVFVNKEYIYRIDDVMDFDEKKDELIEERASVTVSKRDDSLRAREIKCKTIQKPLSDHHMRR